MRTRLILPPWTLFLVLFFFACSLLLFFSSFFFFFLLCPFPLLSLLPFAFLIPFLVLFTLLCLWSFVSLCQIVIPRFTLFSQLNIIPVSSQESHSSRIHTQDTTHLQDSYFSPPTNTPPFLCLLQTRPPFPSRSPFPLLSTLLHAQHTRQEKGVPSHTHNDNHVAPLPACTPPAAPAAFPPSHAATTAAPKPNRKGGQHTIIGCLETGRCCLFLFLRNYRDNDDNSRTDTYDTSSYRTVACSIFKSLPNLNNDTQPSPPLNIGPKVLL